MESMIFVKKKNQRAITQNIEFCVKAYFKVIFDSQELF